MSLEEAFYIIGIVTMSLMLVLMISLVVAVLTIKAKINHLHHIVESKVQVAGAIANTAKSFFAGKKRS